MHAPADDVPFHDLFPLIEAPQHLPRKRGKKIALSVVYRWASHGVDGVRLRTAKVGGVMYTCHKWVWDFFNRDADASAGGRAALTPAQEERELDRIERELAAQGL